MKRAYKFIAWGSALTAFIALAVFGFAIWVFIPVLPALIILVIALTAGGKSIMTEAKPTETKSEDEPDKHTAA
jgi:ABC-type dipeptide/oligopeptide/nickel transport system permease subunit